MPEDHFRAPVADRYDETEAAMFDPAVLESTLDLLGELARGGAALELGIGTGRVALGLAQRGVAVQGIDLSAAMVNRLRGKPGGADIPVTIGDFATTRVQGEFSLVYLVFNTIQNLTTADEQVACFANAAAHLAPGGSFVIEVGVPQLQRLVPGETMHVFDAGTNSLGVDEFDIAAQRLISHHYSTVDGQLQLVSIPFRYVWPSELDLMARLAGLEFGQRWGGWNREPFTSDSAKHVSVWTKPAG